MSESHLHLTGALLLLVAAMTAACSTQPYRMSMQAAVRDASNGYVAVSDERLDKVLVVHDTSGFGTWAAQPDPPVDLGLTREIALLVPKRDATLKVRIERLELRTHASRMFGEDLVTCQFESSVSGVAAVDGRVRTVFSGHVGANASAQAASAKGLSICLRRHAEEIAAVVALSTRH